METGCFMECGVLKICCLLKISIVEIHFIQKFRAFKIDLTLKSIHIIVVSRRCEISLPFETSPFEISFSANEFCIAKVGIPSKFGLFEMSALFEFGFREDCTPSEFGILKVSVPTEFGILEVSIATDEFNIIEKKASQLLNLVVWKLAFHLNSASRKSTLSLNRVLEKSVSP